jgi:hypothetical protein
MEPMPENVELRVGEERSIHLPSLKAAGGAWSHEVSGMASAVEVRKLWEAAPYPDDDEDDEKDRTGPPPDEVFLVRGRSPGTARILLRPGAGGEALREVEVRVRL